MNKQSRRRFLETAAAAGPWIIGCGPTRQAKPPNILIVIADDMSYTDVGCYGSNQVATPNIDRLAREGMRFTRAFTATAMCAPMRQQMYTGIFPVRNGAYPNHSQIKPGIKTWPSYFQEIGYRVGLSGKKHFKPVESFPFEYLSEKDLDFEAIEEFVTRDAKQPYCLFVTSNQPHTPYDRGNPSRHPVDRMHVPDYWVDTPLTRDTLAAYYAECEYLDSEVGRCMDIVERSGTRDDTFFMSSSEQGSAFPFAKWTCYDLGLREALVVRWPGHVAAGSQANAMVQGVDWLPTLLEAAGAPPPEGLDGRSCLGVLNGRTDVHAEEVYGVHTTRGIIYGSECYPIRSIRTQEHKLILNLNHETQFRNIVMSPERDNFWDEWIELAKSDDNAARIVRHYQWRPEVEFYDIVRDPLERTNLAGEEQYRSPIAELRGRLLAFMERQGDRGVQTEMEVTARAGTPAPAREASSRSPA